MEHYDIVVIGSGSGNTILDEDFADRRAAIIDSGAFGGTCLNVGCIPTKMFVLPADFASSPSEAVRVGVDLQFRGASFASIRDRIFGRIDSISKAGLSYRQGLDNIDVYTGEAAFIDAHTLEVGGRCITADQIVLAAGSRPRVPDVPGLDDPSMAGLIHTSDTIMRLAELPQRLVDPWWRAYRGGVRSHLLWARVPGDRYQPFWPDAASRGSRDLAALH